MTNNEFGELLDKKLAGVATKKDIKGLDKRMTNVESAMATKEDLKGLEGRFDFKLIQMEDRFDNKLEAKFSKYTNMVLDRMDRVAGQLKVLWEEKIFQQAQIDRIKEHIGLEV